MYVLMCLCANPALLLNSVEVLREGTNPLTTYDGDKDILISYDTAGLRVIAPPRPRRAPRSGALPALEVFHVQRTPASAAAKSAVKEALKRTASRAVMPS
jgi:hypothetical protein